MSKSLFAAAVDYHVNTELYDRSVCTGPMGQDGILPANDWERGKIEANARSELSLQAKMAQAPILELKPIISSNKVIQESIRIVDSIVERKLPINNKTEGE